MSIDEEVTRDLVQVLADGEQGFSKVADKLATTTNPDWAPRFQELANQRAAFGMELRSLAADYGDDVADGGSIAGVVHRGWLTLQDAISGSDPNGVLDAAEQGEDHAVKAYAEAIQRSDLSAPLRAVIEHQYAEICAAHDFVRGLRDATA